jgi:hypothetical protein
MTKALVAQAVNETRYQNSEILHVIHILEGKFELFFKARHGINFRVNQSEQHPVQLEKGSDFESPPRSIHCPIMVEDKEEHPQMETASP